MPGELEAILSAVEADAETALGSVESSVAASVADVRNSAADAVAKIGLGTAAQVGAPGNKYQTIVKAAGVDWRIWAVAGAGALLLIVVLMRRGK